MDIILRHQIDQLLEERSPHGMGELFNELLVEYLTCQGFVQTEALREALLATPRHEFLPGVDLSHAYRDQAVATVCDESGWFQSSCSTPSIICAMLEALELEGAKRILELGSGTGYTAALMSRCAPDAEIVSLEVLEEVAESTKIRLQGMGLSSIEIRSADGSHGSAGPGPYDRIVLACGAAEIPMDIVDMLAEGGLLVIPIGSCVFAFRKCGHELRGRPVIVATFIAFANDKPQSVWRTHDGVSVLWPHQIQRDSFELGEPDQVVEGPEVHSHQIASWLLWTSLLYPDAHVTMATKAGRWGFGLFDEKSHSTILCQLEGEFSFRHYGNRIEHTHFECWGDLEVSERFLAISEDLAALGWPEFERLAISVDLTGDLPSELGSNQFLVGDHTWNFEISGFEIFHPEVGPVTQEAICPAGVNEDHSFSRSDHLPLD